MLQGQVAGGRSGTAAHPLTERLLTRHAPGVTLTTRGLPHAGRFGQVLPEVGGLDDVDEPEEGVNLTNHKVLKYAYYENQFLYAEDSGRRYKLGVRAQF